MTEHVRYPAVAGAFYPNEPTQLREMVESYLAHSRVLPAANSHLRALIAPHAGYIYSGPVAGTCYRQLDGLDKDRHWKILLLGPAHRYPVRGVSVCAYDSFVTPLGSVKVSPLAQVLAKQLGFVPAADVQEHSLEVQLPFLQVQLPHFEIIPLVIGSAPPDQLAGILLPFLDTETLLVISTDLSHYFSYDEAVATDSIANAAIPALDLATMASKGDACGIVGVMTCMHIAKQLNWQGELLDYRNSGDTAGPKDRVVGYGAYSFCEAA